MIPSTRTFANPCCFHFGVSRPGLNSKSADGPGPSRGSCPAPQLLMWLQCNLSLQQNRIKRYSKQRLRLDLAENWDFAIFHGFWLAFFHIFSQVPGFVPSLAGNRLKQKQIQGAGAREPREGRPVDLEISNRGGVTGGALRISI